MTTNIILGVGLSFAALFTILVVCGMRPTFDGIDEMRAWREQERINDGDATEDGH